MVHGLESNIAMSQYTTTMPSRARQQSRTSSQTQRPYTDVHQLGFSGPPFINLFDPHIHNNKLPHLSIETEKKVNFLPPCIALILGSTYFLVVLCILIIIPILQLTIGIVYRNQCPVNFYIPIYLIVAGSFGFANISLMLLIVRHDDLFLPFRTIINYNYRV
jgi:hypothetical protein